MPENSLRKSSRFAEVGSENAIKPRIRTTSPDALFVCRQQLSAHARLTEPRVALLFIRSWRLLMATHQVCPGSETLRGYITRELPPILTIDSGDRVGYQTLDAAWGASAQTSR